MRRHPRQLSVKECYAILKLGKGADLQAVKKAYRQRAFELHPDLNPGNPEAAHDFQLLNEAYVALSAVLKPEEARREAAEAARRKAEEEKRQENREQAKQTRQEEQKGETGQRSAETSDPKSQSASSQPDGAQEAADNRETGAYAEQDVLRDLLNDPFARRVFEDIYSELGKQQDNDPAEKQIGQQKTAPERKNPFSFKLPNFRLFGKPGKTNARQAAHSVDSQKIVNGQGASRPARPSTQRKQVENTGIDGVAGAVGGAVKGWLRKQIDDEQSLKLPAASLVPGRHVRLKIRKGISGELVTVEIALPADFAVGKPIRLRGLGKQVGPWQGDLYLTIYSE